MARIFIDGFESGGLENWNSKSAGAGVTAAGGGMSGSYCLDIDGTYEYVFKILPATKTTLYVAFKYSSQSTVGGGTIIQFLDSAGTEILCVIRNTTSGYLEIRRGNRSGTLLDTGTTYIAVNTTWLIEVYYVPLNSGGAVQLKVNNNPVEAEFSGDTTGGEELINSVRFGDTGTYSRCYIDDIVIDDADWIGPTRIQGLVPTGAGTTTQWDPSAGSNYACVDERPASDSDYVSTNVTDEIDTYATGDMTGTIDSIKCVQIQARCGKDGVPTPTQLQLAVRSGGTNYFSASKAVPSVFGVPVWAIWEDNPADSADWEEADVNAMEIGIKAAA